MSGPSGPAMTIATTTTQELPKLSATDYREYNRLAEHMDLFMPAFREELELLTQHKQIHAGLEGFEKYLNDCRGGERELRMEELKDLMDKFGKVLWEHLDDEVKQLGAENMRKYWTKDEMRHLQL
ncbi:MAG: hypothetical protein Q9227_005859 [Pyrenula ochraceoflavens]